MTGKIYLIRNVINGKGYVGQTTVGVKRRFAKHLENSKLGVDFALYRAIRKHGIVNFSIIEVATCDPMLLDDLEKHYVKFYGTSAIDGHGYNMTAGGDSARRPKGSRNSDESKIAESLKGKKKAPRSLEYKANMSAAKKGQGKGELWSDARRLAHKGAINVYRQHNG